MEIFITVDADFCRAFAENNPEVWRMMGHDAFDKYVLDYARNSVLLAIEDGDLPKDDIASHEDYIDEMEEDWIKQWCAYPNKKVYLGNSEFCVHEFVCEFMATAPELELNFEWTWG